MGGCSGRKSTLYHLENNYSFYLLSLSFCELPSWGSDLSARWLTGSDGLHLSEETMVCKASNIGVDHNAIWISFFWPGRNSSPYVGLNRALMSILGNLEGYCNTAPSRDQGLHQERRPLNCLGNGLKLENKYSTFPPWFQSCSLEGILVWCFSHTSSLQVKVII